MCVHRGKVILKTASGRTLAKASGPVNNDQQRKGSRESKRFGTRACNYDSE